MVLLNFDWIEYTGSTNFKNPVQAVPTCTIELTVGGIQKNYREQTKETVNVPSWEKGETEHFKIENTGRGSQYFRDVFNVSFKDGGLKFVTLEMNPRVSFIAPDLVKVKVNNRFCYDKDIKEKILLLNSQVGITFKNFTRLDLCADMQSTAGEYGCYDLLKALAKREILVKQKQKFSIYGKGENYTGMTFGTVTSGVSVTYYNKSNEMREKVSKPWIIEQWEQIGFDKELDTYRLEFRCKKPKKSHFVIEGETGEIASYNDFSIEALDKGIECFKYLHETHFQLGANDGLRWGKKDGINVIPALDAPVMVRIKNDNRAKSSNHTKYLIKTYIAKAESYYRAKDWLMCHMLCDMVDAMIQKHGLTEWAKINKYNVTLLEQKIDYNNADWKFYLDRKKFAALDVFANFSNDFE